LIFNQKMKTVIVLFLFAAVVLAIYPNDRNEFVRWSSLNMKTYAADEMRARYAVWKKMLIILTNSTLEMPLSPLP